MRSCGGYGDDGKRDDSAFGNDGGYGCGSVGHNGRRAALRSGALPYRHIRGPSRRRRTCKGKHRNGPVHCGDACRRVHLRRDRPDRRVLRQRAAHGVCVRLHEPAPRRGRPCDAARDDARADTRGRRAQRSRYIRTSRAHLRRAALCSVRGNAAHGDSVALEGDVCAVFGMPALLDIHNDDRRAGNGAR